MLHCQHHANLSTRAGPIRAKRQPPQIPATIPAALQMSCNSNHHILPEIRPNYRRSRRPTPLPQEKKLDDIGLYWATLDDMSRRILPKREDFASSGQRSQTTAMAGLQTRQSCHQRRHEPGQFCQVENVESLGLTRETAWKLEGARLKPSAFTLYRSTASGWQRQWLTTADAPISGLLPLANQTLVALTDRLVVSAGGSEWEPVESGVDGQSLAALGQSGEQVVVVTSDGQIWQGRHAAD